MSDAGSRRLFERAQELLPGGVDSPVRAFGGVGGTPRFLVRGAASRVYDVDGNGYIDYVGSWGPLILGHAHPRVVTAVERAARSGTSFGAPSPLEVELAELILAAMPSIEMLRFVSSGTEACMSALRLARACTGRDLIVKFEGCYHGHADALLVAAGSGGLTFGVPSSAGVPAPVAAGTLVVPYNDLEALERAFANAGRSIACVIVEPIAANMGLVPPQAGFLRGIVEIAKRHGALVIFDEVITGFRVGPGGAQGLYGIAPDLTCLGKVIGAGLPVGAFGGRADLMRRLAPLGDVYQAGTLSGNPLAMAAGIAQLSELAAAGTYERLDAVSASLEAGLRSVVAEQGARVQLQRVGSIFGMFWTEQPARDLSEVRRADAAAYAAFFQAMLARGVYLAPSAFEVGFVSTVHSRADVDDTIAAAREALDAMRAPVRA